MPTGSALGSYRQSLWGNIKPIESKPVLKKSTSIIDSSINKQIATVLATVEQKQKEQLGQQEQRSSRAAYLWDMVRKAVNAARFWKRMAIVATDNSGAYLGSLKEFVDKRKFKNVVWTNVDEKLQQEKNEAFQAKKFADVAFTKVKEACVDQIDVQMTSRPHTVPSTKVAKLGGSRRIVARVGNALSVKRSASPRNLQFLQMLPFLAEEEEVPWNMSLGRTIMEKMARTGNSIGKQSWGVSTASRPFTAPALPVLPDKVVGEFKHVSHRVQTWRQASRKPPAPPETAKPRAEVHPLLDAIEGMERDDVIQQPPVQADLLTHRLEELRWSEMRKGMWTSKPEGKHAEKDGKPSKQKERRQGDRAFDAPGKMLIAAGIAQSAAKSGIKDIHGDSESMERLMRIMDPERKGVIAAEVFVPLFFWLGLTRRRAAVLTTLELAFGRGDIPASAIQNLSRYAEVQIRLIEGLRRLARRESLEQLCEYIIDMARLRSWFGTMKRDTTGRADIVEVQNLFARMEVTSDRQTLFRFLTYLVHCDDSTGGERTLGIGDFASLLCRCAAAWCVHRTLILIDPSENTWKGDGDGPLMAPAADLDREAEMRWVALQRKIIVSLLVNHRFWGKESRTVLSSLNQPQMTTLGNQISPEQWLSLFQRVRAQGIASTLPVADEASDPEWLLKRVTAGGTFTSRKAVFEEGAPSSRKA